MVVRPPVTNRFCLQCEAKTSFRYNPTIGHSECCRCGGRFAIGEHGYQYIMKLKNTIMLLRKELKESKKSVVTTKGDCV